MINSEEHARYARHYVLPEVGVAGQQRLKNSSVLIIGAGGLGSPASLYLAAAGVGRIGIVDHDRVELSNLQRQIIYRTTDRHQPKAKAAVEQLRGLNPYIEFDTHNVKFNKDNALNLVSQYQYIIDCTDNFATRYLINDACIMAKIPYVYAAIFRFEGQVMVFLHQDGPCYRCLYPEPPSEELTPNCVEAGVLGVLPGLLGTIQATQILKLILGIGRPLVNELLVVDSLEMSFRKLHIQKNPHCGGCSDNQRTESFSGYEPFCLTSNACPEIGPKEWQIRCAQKNPPFLLDVRENHEFVADNMGGHLIPLSDINKRMDELLPYKPTQIVVHCRSGARSKEATLILRDHGYDAINLTGGILAWRKFLCASSPNTDGSA